MRALEYVLLAEAFGWTPRQVDDEIPAWLMPWIIPLFNLLQEVRGSDESGRR